MQPEYLARLSGSVQEFIRQVEKQSRLEIEVSLESQLNNGGPLGLGNLEVDITDRRIQLFAPSNGYFPDGAVRHEVLHVQRFHVEGVPKLAIANEVSWDEGLRDGLARLDNAVEHIVIVPQELQFHPERRLHWEAVMSHIVSELPFVPEGERRLAACLHWAFLRHALPDSPQVESARRFLHEHALAEVADAFADQFLSATTDKEEMVRILFLTFPEIPKDRAAFEYVNSVTGTRQTRIP
jgi:hypothetical protein